MNEYTLITGAASGMGRAFAEYYTKQKENLILIDKNKIELENLAKQLQMKDSKIIVLAVDLSNPDKTYSIYDEINKQDIFVNRLINCAGFATNGFVNETDFMAQHNQIMVNVVALFDLTKLFLANMIKYNQGEIVNIASSSAYHPLPTMAVYAATKSFVLLFTEALATECKNTKIKILAMSPGATKTNFFSNGGVAYGTLRTPENVVRESVKALKQNKISKIDGLNNYFTSTLMPRIFPRKLMANTVYNIMTKQIEEN